MSSKLSPKKHWIKVGLIWGVIMFVTMAIVFPWVNNDEITLKGILIGIVLWSIGGLSFGLAMWKINAKNDLNNQ